MNAAGKNSPGGGNREIEDIVPNTKRLSNGVKTGGEAEEDLRGALASLCPAPGLHRTPDSMEAAKKRACIEEGEQVAAALESDIVDALTEEETAAKGGADDGASAGLYESGDKELMRLMCLAKRLGDNSDTRA